MSLLLANSLLSRRQHQSASFANKIAKNAKIFSTNAIIDTHVPHFKLTTGCSSSRRDLHSIAFTHASRKYSWTQRKHPNISSAPASTASLISSPISPKRNYVSFTVSPRNGKQEDFFKACEKAASRLSFTRIQDYKSCPLKFRFKYVEKKRTPMNEHALRGSALHEAIAVFGTWYIDRDLDVKNPKEKDVFFPPEKLLRLKPEEIQQLSEDNMKLLMFRVYKEVWRRNMNTLSYKGTKEQLKQFYEQGKRMLWKFYARESSMMHKMKSDASGTQGEEEAFMEDTHTEFDEVYGFANVEASEGPFGGSGKVVDTTIRTPQMVETRFSFDIDREGKKPIKVSGIFDRIDRAHSVNMNLNNDIIVVEYKTALKEYAKQNHHNQVKLYTYAYQRVHGIRPSKGMIFSISDDQCYVYEPRTRDAKDVEGIIARVSDSIANGYFRPKPDFNKCKFCDFRNICPSSAYQRNPNIKTDVEEYEESDDEGADVVLGTADNTGSIQSRNTSRMQTVSSAAKGTNPNLTTEDESDLEDEEDDAVMMSPQNTRQVSSSGATPGSSIKSQPHELKGSSAPLDEDYGSEDDDDDSILLPVRETASPRKKAAELQKKAAEAKKSNNDEWDDEDEDSDDEV